MGSFDEVVVTNGQFGSDRIESQCLGSTPGKTRCGKEILLIMREDAECLNLRFSAASVTESESLLHLFKLDCHVPECEGLDCNHGCYKSVGESSIYH